HELNAFLPQHTRHQPIQSIGWDQMQGMNRHMNTHTVFCLTRRELVAEFVSHAVPFHLVRELPFSKMNGGLHQTLTRNAQQIRLHALGVFSPALKSLQVEDVGWQALVKERKYFPVFSQNIPTPGFGLQFQQFSHQRLVTGKKAWLLAWRW